MSRVRRYLVRSAVLVTLLFVVAILAFASSARATELVVNGGFETGDLTGWSAAWGCCTGVAAYNPHSGSYAFYQGDVGSWSNLLQSLATVPGNSYTFSFWLANDFGGGYNSFDAWWNGTQLLSMVDAPAVGYTNYSYTVTAVGADTIKFVARHDPSYFYLDDVSVQGAGPAVPEPGSLVLLGLGLAGLKARRRK